jgi:periplasmic protein TonB
MMSSVLAAGELRRWAVSAAVVLGLHAGIAALVMTWHEPAAGFGEPSDAVAIDLAPFVTPPSDTVEDIAPGPKQQEAEAQPPEREPVEKPPDEKVDVPPSPEPPVAAVAPPEPETPELPKPTPEPPAPATTAPPRARASQAEMKTWANSIVAHIDRTKQAYPRSAQARDEKGVVRLAFSIDRAGRVVSSRVERSSGYPALDEEALDALRRAQPFPVPPADLDGPTFDFRMPYGFRIR